MIDLLDKKFLSLVSELIHNCRKRGIIMIPYEKLRPPQIQADYWVQGRSEEVILAKTNELKQFNALFLSKCLENSAKKKY